MLISYCKNCIIEIKYKPSQKGGLYCSNKCQKEYEHLKNYYEWLNGNTSVWSNYVAFKNAVIRRDGYSCFKCGILEWNNKHLVLELEHIDGNSNNFLSNNLCLLCPNCHSQTDTYKGKNAGNGRHFRKVRYAQGKSPLSISVDAIAL